MSGRCLYGECQSEGTFRARDLNAPDGNLLMCEVHWALVRPSLERPRKLRPEVLQECIDLGQVELREIVGEMRRLGVVEAFGIRLDPHWAPPTLPEAEPQLDTNPQANALAVAALRAKDNLEKELRQRAADDAVTFAHTGGMPDGD